MRVKILRISFFIIFSIGFTSLINSQTEKMSDNDTINGVYIPTDINDCFKQIDKFWPDSLKDKVKQMSEGKFFAECHLGFGLWMRNYWGLRNGSRLSKYFNELGVYFPDSMSGIILHSYHRYLLNQDIRLEEQIRDSQPKLFHKQKRQKRNK